jgi:adenosylmethionine-8-amino-7-oxononanoate aminotransferase
VPEIRPIRRDRRRSGAQSIRPDAFGIWSERLYDAGLICRADDRGDPVVQISPPLVAGQPEFDEVARILRQVLGEAAERLS